MKVEMRDFLLTSKRMSRRGLLAGSMFAAGAEAAAAASIAPKRDGREVEVGWASKPEDFGARGNGIDDDGPAIRRALEVDAPLFLNPRKSYRVQGNLSVTRPSTHIFSTNVGRITAGGRIEFVGNAPTAIEVNASNAVFSGVTLRGAGRDANAALVRFNRGPGRPADIDMRITNCLLEGAACLISFRGRGLHVDGCTLNDSRVGIEVGFPANVAPPMHVWATPEGGARAYRIHGNRFHACSRSSIEVVDEGAEYLHGIIVTDNYQDGEQSFFSGHLHYGLLASNIAIRCVRSAIIVHSSRSGSVFSNLFTGIPFDSTTLATRYPHLPNAPKYMAAGAVLRDVTGFSIAHNVFAWSRGPGIVFKGSSKAVDCLYNRFENVVLGGRSAVIGFDGEALTEGSFVGNRVLLPETVAVESSFARVLGKCRVDQLYASDNRGNFGHKWRDLQPHRLPDD
jgi:hypothetical protein